MVLGIFVGLAMFHCSTVPKTSSSSRQLLVPTVALVEDGGLRLSQAYTARIPEIAELVKAAATVLVICSSVFVLYDETVVNAQRLSNGHSLCNAEGRRAKSDGH